MANEISTFTLEPRNLAEAMEFAKIIAGSDMVPKDYINKPGNVLVAVQTGAEVGLKPMQSLQGIAVINGRPAIWGDAMWALVTSHPEFESFSDDNTDSKSTIVLKRRGQPALTRSFSMDDAKKAGLAGKSGPWATNPKRMLQMRARAFACRDLFADALKGIKSIEEVRDYQEQEKDMGAAVVVVDEKINADALIAEVQTMKTPATTRAHWAANNATLHKHPAEHKRYKDAMVAHGLALKAAEELRTAAHAARADAAQTVEVKDVEPSQSAQNTDAEKLAAFDETYTPE